MTTILNLPRRTVLAAAIALGLVACEAGLDRAQNPTWGKQPCDHCAMLVTEPKPAAQLVSAKGERLYFDDVGCMVAWVAEKGEPKHMWVRAPEGEGWVEAKTARFASGVRTPMDYGFVPASEGVGWDEVTKKVLEKVNAP